MIWCFYLWIVVVHQCSLADNLNYSINFYNFKWITVPFYCILPASTRAACSPMTSPFFQTRPVATFLKLASAISISRRKPSCTTSPPSRNVPGPSTFEHSATNGAEQGLRRERSEHDSEERWNWLERCPTASSSFIIKQSFWSRTTKNM